jgi:arginine deiminase
VSYTHGADSEVGRLRSVLVHRPGLELKRITPRRRDWLLFDALPWVGRAQQEHDALAAALRDHGVEVLYITELLQDVMEYQAARDEAISGALGGARLGDDLADQIRGHLAGLDPEALTQVLIAGLTPAELRVALTKGCGYPGPSPSSKRRPRRWASSGCRSSAPASTR